MEEHQRSTCQDISPRYQIATPIHPLNVSGRMLVGNRYSNSDYAFALVPMGSASDEAPCFAAYYYA